MHIYSQNLLSFLIQYFFNSLGYIFNLSLQILSNLIGFEFFLDLKSYYLRFRSLVVHTCNYSNQLFFWNCITNNMDIWLIIPLYIIFSKLRLFINNCSFSLLISLFKQFVGYNTLFLYNTHFKILCTPIEYLIGIIWMMSQSTHSTLLIR